jgi:hypothetical protein
MASRSAGNGWAAGRRELLIFLATAGLAAFAIAALYHQHPWPTPLRAQADLLGWVQTGLYVAMGAAGALVLPWTGVARTPGWPERGRWGRILIWSLGIGLIYGAVDLAINAFTPWGAHIAANDRANGHAWANVALPWSLLHYAHGAILSECAFRLAPIVIATWLVSRVLLRGRFEAPVFWSFAILAAFIEPLEKAVLLRKWPLDGLSRMEQAMTFEAVFWQFVFAVLLRRFGWAAPIIARYGYYLAVRVFAG